MDTEAIGLKPIADGLRQFLKTSPVKRSMTPSAIRSSL